ncbi:MAG: pyridoxal-phosphate dependent enzyme, partial [Candidatus Eisenbacteria bacterium]|nr:pyridoxal-phosphate dependent enzyme [Candidatus Eisenbacteria bacterium]
MRAPNLRTYRPTTGPPPWAKVALIRVEPTHSSKAWRTRVESLVRALPIGNTPLIRLRVLEPHDRVQIYAKTEWSNAGGSVKDRAAQSMILNGLNTGQLTEGKTLVDASSGNTGLAYAMIGAHAGFPVRVYLPENVSEARLRLLRTYGADVVLTDG